MKTETAESTPRRRPQSNKPIRQRGRVKTVQRPATPNIQIVADPKTHEQIIALRKRELRPVYPEMDFDNDVLDEQAVILYTRDYLGNPDTTVRLSIEGRYPLPEGAYLDTYREKGLRLMELGRFVKTDGSRELLRAYYRTFYTLASCLGYDVIVMAMQQGHISFHKRLMGLNVIAQTTGVTYGGKHDLACVGWEIKQTQPAFFEWINK